MTGDPSSEHQLKPASPIGDPEQSWRILSLVNDWIKHAETKAAGTLAAAGVIGGVLFSLVKDQHDTGKVLAVAAVTCATFVILGGLAAAWALRPLLWSRDEPTSHLYFHHIARAHLRKTKGENYLTALRELTQNQEALVAEIAAQVWSNAQVAKSKYRWANVGLTFILLALISLGATAMCVALENR
jgi:hypothetical protein